MEFTRSKIYDGTSLQGYLTTSFYQLKKSFGEPDDDGGDGKTRANWCLKFADGTVATIYDWKCYGTPVEEVREWNIGGVNTLAVERVMEALGINSYKYV